MKTASFSRSLVRALSSHSPGASHGSSLCTVAVLVPYLHPPQAPLRVTRSLLKFSQTMARPSP